MASHWFPATKSLKGKGIPLAAVSSPFPFEDLREFSEIVKGPFGVKIMLNDVPDGLKNIRGDGLRHLSRTGNDDRFRKKERKWLGRDKPRHVFFFFFVSSKSDLSRPW